MPVYHLPKSIKPEPKSYQIIFAGMRLQMPRIDPGMPCRSTEQDTASAPWQAGTTAFLSSSAKSFPACNISGRRTSKTILFFLNENRFSAPDPTPVFCVSAEQILYYPKTAVETAAHRRQTRR
jgi:hypothetical protein